MLLWILVLLGILVWPELTLCLLLFFYGHPMLAFVAFITSFYSGKQFVWDKIKDKQNKEDYVRN